MEKKKAAKKEDKSDFLRRLVRENPRMTYHEMNRRWAAAGHAGEISSALYNRVRADVAIQLMEERAVPREVEVDRAGQSQRLPVVICQFKITLLDVLPLVWRRIQVQNRCSLDTLHEHIQNAMGWADTHPHHFVIDGMLYGSSTVLGDTFTERHYWRTSTTDLKDILPKDSSRFRFEYEYDFESSWRHEILFEGRPPGEEHHHYPLCVEGQRLPARGRGRPGGLRRLPPGHRRSQRPAASRDAPTARPPLPPRGVRPQGGDPGHEFPPVGAELAVPAALKAGRRRCPCSLEASARTISVGTVRSANVSGSVSQNEINGPVDPVS